MDPVFIPKKGLLKLADRCLLYKKKNGKRKKINLEVHQHSFFFYFFNHSLPPSTSPLIQTELTDEELRLAYHCVLMSNLAYEDRTQIIFPSDVSVVYEEFESDITKIPFFIVVDKEVNAIIVSCRGSSCMNDFVTDSMGNGINFDGGKVHQGVFNTASYVFLQCQNTILDLNRDYNGETVLPINTSSIPRIGQQIQVTKANTEFLNNTSNTLQSTRFNGDADSSSDSTYTSDSNYTPSIIKANKNIKYNNGGKKNKKNGKNDNDANKADNDDNYNENNNEEEESDEFNVEKEKRMKIIITGHSLGAAVAAVVAHFFRREFPKLEVTAMCFAPPPTFSFNLWEKSANYIKSFMIEGDMVPFLSVQNIFKFTKVLFPSDNNKFIVKFIEKYLKKMSIDEVTETFMNEKLYPPGQSYLIRLPQTNPNKEKKKHQKLTKLEKKEIKEINLIKHKNISLCQILNPEYFSNFVKNIQETNHKCKNYMKVIIRLRQQQIQEQDIEEIIRRKYLKKMNLDDDFDETEEDGVERIA